MTATHIINRLPNTVLKHKTPYEVLYSTKPLYNHLKSFGCLAMASNPTRTSDKFQARGVPCVMLGYPQHQKGYKLLNLTNNIMFVSRDVKFYETIFPYKIFSSHSSLTPQSSQTPQNCPETYTDCPEPQPQIPDPVENIIPENVAPNIEPDLIPEAPAPPELRKSTRTLRQPEWMKDYHTSNMSVKCEPRNIEKIIEATCSPVFSCFMSQITKHKEPRHFKEAVQSEKWVKAMNEELDALEINETWQITSLPPGKTAIGCKWLYKIKYSPDGSIERYKSRLVVLGNRQKFGVDYEQTFAPVAKMATVRSLLAVASLKGWHVHQMDVKNALLHGEL